MIELDASILRPCTYDDRYEAAICSEEYEMGWNRPDIKSTALTWRFLRSGWIPRRCQSCVVLHVYINFVTIDVNDDDTITRP